MAKTQKRQVSKGTYKPSGSPNVAGGSRYTSATEFNPDYTYVISDMKRIGVLMGSFTVILIVLSFILK